MNNIWILAQAETKEAPSRITSEPVTSEGEAITTVSDSNAPVQEAPPPKSPLLQFLPIILIFVVMYLILFRGPRKKQQQHKKMVQSLAKNDRVRTIGGIIGKNCIKGDLGGGFLAEVVLGSAATVVVVVVSSALTGSEETPEGAWSPCA